jgi:hypothetical protein
MERMDVFQTKNVVLLELVSLNVLLRQLQQIAHHFYLHALLFRVL